MSITEELDQLIKEYGSARDALNVTLAKLRQAEREIEILKEISVKEDEWMEAVRETCLCDWVQFDANDPEGTLNRLIQENVSESLDPAISKPAADLRDTYKAQRDELRTALIRAKKMLGPHSLLADAEGYCVIESALDHSSDVE